MNASKLLIATSFSLAVAGAFAQTTTPNTLNSGATSQDQAQGQMPGTTARDGTMPGSMNQNTQRPYDSTTSGTDTTGSRNSTGTYGTTGTAGTGSTRSNDGTMGYPSDRSTMGMERTARADRN